MQLTQLPMSLIRQRRKKVGVGGDDGHDERKNDQREVDIERKTEDERQRQVHRDRAGSPQERSAARWHDRFLRGRRTAPGVSDGPWLWGFAQGGAGRGR